MSSNSTFAMTEARFRMVGIGEVLWDLLPAGKQLGGAPANFAYIANSLGDKGIVLSRVGDDADGFEIRERLNAFGLSDRAVQTDGDHPTETVRVSLEKEQPVYNIVENTAWDFLELTESWREIARRVDAVCFGSLAQRREMSRNTIRKFVELTNESALRIYDVNLRQHYFSEEIVRESLFLANVVKLNHEELHVVAKLLGLEEKGETELAQRLRAAFDLDLVCLTRGGRGSLLINADGPSEHRGERVEVADTIGAGDSFTAMVAHGLVRGWSLDTINEKANKLAAFVASTTGAMPEFSVEAGLNLA